MSTAPNTPTLAQAVRTKYPGAYDDMDDVTLEQKVLAKYPQYADFPRTQSAPNAGLAGAERPQVNMQQSLLGHQDNSDPDLQRLNRGIQAGNTAPMPEDAFIGAGAASLALGAPAAGRFVARQAAAHPVITAMVGQQLVHEARKIPVIGPHIPSWAEMLPFLYSGKGEPEGGAPIERDATRGNEPFAGEEEQPSQPQNLAPIERDTTRQNVPFAGEGQQANSAAPPPQTSSKLPWVPAQPTTQWPRPGSPEDLAETKQIQEQVRNTADAENNALQRLGNQERYARSNKSELNGSQNAPVTLTKTPSASTIKPKVGNSPPPKAPYYLSGGAQTTGNAPQGQSEDLTDILQKSLDQVKKRKAQQ